MPPTPEPPTSDQYDDDDVCPDCGFTTERNVLVRLPGASEEPCGACLWAHDRALSSPPVADPDTPTEAPERWGGALTAKGHNALNDKLLRLEDELAEVVAERDRHEASFKLAAKLATEMAVKAAEFEAERDEARAERDRYRDALIAIATSGCECDEDDEPGTCWPHVADKALTEGTADV